MINYISSLANITSEQLAGFFVDWTNPPSPKTHLQILQGSYRVVLAMEEETAKVVGFITAISDGVLSAYIPLLEVLPAYQMQGIGKELVKRMLTELNDFYMIDLLCDEELKEYYDKLGMKKATGMFVRNYAYQAGKERGDYK